VELRDTELRPKMAETAWAKKNITHSKDLIMRLRAMSLRAPMCPKMSRQPILKEWTKTWTLGTHMPKLTEAALRGLIKKPGRHSDGGGLYFRVISEGKAYFVYRYRFGGKEREASLGPYSDLSLKDARETHAELRALVLKEKADPLGERRRMKTMQSVAAVPTFGDMADAYVETHEAT
jgi:hypothetical protein